MKRRSLFLRLLAIFRRHRSERFRLELDLRVARGQTQNWKAKAESLERRINIYADGRAYADILRDSVQLCINVDLPTFREHPAILDTAIDRLRHDFIKTVNRR